MWSLGRLLQEKVVLERIIVLDIYFILLPQIIRLLFKAHSTIQVVVARVCWGTEITLGVREVAEHVTFIQTIKRILFLMPPSTFHAAIFLALLGAMGSLVSFTSRSGWFSNKNLTLAVLPSIKFKLFHCRLLAVHCTPICLNL